MGTTQTKVQICNLALGALNAGIVSDIDEPSDSLERLCGDRYDPVRRSTLRRHDWNFATKRVLLAKSPDKPAFRYESQYPIPSDFIKFVSIGDFDDVVDYKFEDRKILIDGSSISTTGTEALPFRYIFDFTTVADFDPLFVEVLSLELALKLAPALSGKATLMQQIRSEIELLITEAYSIDGQESPPERIERSKYLAARRGNIGAKNIGVGTPFIIFDT